MFAFAPLVGAKRTSLSVVDLAVTGTSRGADAECLYGLNSQHDPWQASSLAWRTGGDNDGLLPLRVWLSAARARPGDTAYSRFDQSRPEAALASRSDCLTVAVPGAPLIDLTGLIILTTVTGGQASSATTPQGAIAPRDERQTIGVAGHALVLWQLEFLLGLVPALSRLTHLFHFRRGILI